MVPIMEQKQCNRCSHQNSCQEIYEHISNTKGPSVLRKTVLALLLPLIIFIVAMAICEKVLETVPANQPAKVLLSILSGIIAVFLYVVIIKKWSFENQD